MKFFDNVEEKIALGVKVTRRFDIKENSVVLTDEYKCDNFENHKITERFISVIKPELL